MNIEPGIIELIIQIGVQHLPTVTVCACLWVVINKGNDEKK
jgi:hypothetical protein